MTDLFAQQAEPRAEAPSDDTLVSWAATGLAIGVLAVGVGGVAIAAGVGYGLLAGLAVGWFATRRS